MVEVVITGVGLISALGNLENTWKSLIAGKSGIIPRQIFTELPIFPLALIGKIPNNLTNITELVVAAALKDADLLPPLINCGVVIGSSRSCQASWEELARQFYSSSQQKLGCQDFNSTVSLTSLAQENTTKLEHWLDTLPNFAAIATARQIISTAPVLAPMAACATGIWAIAQAYNLIQTGQCQRVIAGAVEAAITPLTLAGFDKMGALAKTGAYPFDKHREGLVLGEGGAVFVLETAELARRRAAKIYGQVLGFGLTADAYHVCATDSRGRSAIAAVKQCLERSKISPMDIDYIHAHGTATQLNDQHEAQLIKYLFPQNVPVSSTKGATGHTLGASGALGVAFCLMAMKSNLLPPSVGLTQPEFDLNFVTVGQSREVQKTLCLSFGFGGQNAVVALSKA
ncbi:MAG: beta-ketoacyl-ACP synthase [Crinalium sp.]